MIALRLQTGERNSSGTPTLPSGSNCRNYETLRIRKLLGGGGGGDIIGGGGVGGEGIAAQG